MFSERKNKANPTSLRKELMVVWGMEANSPLARRVGDPTPWEPWEMVAGHATLPWHRATPPCPSLPLSLPPPLSNPLSMVSSFRPQSLRQQKRRFLLSISSLYIFFLSVALFISLVYSSAHLYRHRRRPAVLPTQQESFQVSSSASLKFPAGSRSVTEWSLWDRPQHIHNLGFDCVPS